LQTSTVDIGNSSTASFAKNLAPLIAAVLNLDCPAALNITLLPTLTTGQYTVMVSVDGSAAAQQQGIYENARGPEDCIELMALTVALTNLTAVDQGYAILLSCELACGACYRVCGAPADIEPAIEYVEPPRSDKTSGEMAVGAVLGLLCLLLALILFRRRRQRLASDTNDKSIDTQSRSYLSSGYKLDPTDIVLDKDDASFMG
jgi:hypothetical protein